MLAAEIAVARLEQCIEFEWNGHRFVGMLTEKHPHNLGGAWELGAGTATISAPGLVDRERDDWVRLRAYYLWADAGSPDGASLEHWLAAEAQEAGDRIGTGAPTSLSIPLRMLSALRRN